MEDMGPAPAQNLGWKMTMMSRNWPSQVLGLTRWPSIWPDLSSLCRGPSCPAKFGSHCQEDLHCQVELVAGQSAECWGAQVWIKQVSDPQESPTLAEKYSTNIYQLPAICLLRTHAGILNSACWLFLSWSLQSSRHKDNWNSEVSATVRREHEAATVSSVQRFRERRVPGQSNS